MYNLRTYQQYRDGKRGVDIADYTINTDAYSINVPGDGCLNYSPSLAETISWMTTNFAYSTPPEHPLIGQLWYDNVNQTLNVCSNNIPNSITWDKVEEKNIDTSAIVKDLIPDSTDLDIGSPSNQFFELFVNNIYADTVTFKNDDGSIKDIVIDSDGCNKINYQSSYYTDSSGISANLNTSISALVTKLKSGGQAANWTVYNHPMSHNFYPDELYSYQPIYMVHARENSINLVNVDVGKKVSSADTYYHADIGITVDKYNTDFQIVFTSPLNCELRIIHDQIAGYSTIESIGKYSGANALATDYGIPNRPAFAHLNFINGYELSEVYNQTSLTIFVAPFRTVVFTYLRTNIEGEWDVIVSKEV